MSGRSRELCKWCKQERAIGSTVYGYCSWSCADADPEMDQFKSPCPGCGKMIVKFDNRSYCNSSCKRINGGNVRRPLSKTVRNKIMKRHNWTCVYCGSKAEHIDHIIPVASSGTDDLDNLVASCVSCNLIAKDRLFDSLEEKKRFILSHRDNTGVEKPKDNKPDWRARVYGGVR